MLRSQFRSSTLDYYGGVRTWELQAGSDLFDWSYPFHGSAPSELAAIAKQRRGYDLIVNIERASPDKIFAGSLATEDSMICGPCSDGPGHDIAFADDPQGALWMDRDWIAPDLVARHPILKTGFIGEIFCRGCYLEGPIPPYKVECEDPSIAIPPVLISTAGSSPDKLWPAKNWIAVLTEIKAQGLEAGLLGANPIQQQQFWKGTEGEDEIVASGLVRDLRGKLRLPEVVGALKACKLAVTLDNGILHLAASVQRKTVGIYRYGIHRLWAPPNENLKVVIPSENCPVSSVSVDQVLQAVSSAI